MASPTFPFSGSSSATVPSVVSTSSTNPPSGLISPPGSRRTSGDEPSVAAPALGRQSLPSISEALGPNTLLRYLPTSSLPPAPSAPTDAVSQRSPNMNGTEPSRYSHYKPSHAPERPLHGPPPLLQGHLNGQPAGGPAPVSFAVSHAPKLPTLQPSSNIHSPIGRIRPNLSYPPLASHNEPQPPSQTIMGPHTLSPDLRQYRAPMPVPSSAALYPSPTHSLPPQLTPTWRAGGVEEADGRLVNSKPSGLAYGEVVKRQLDIFDLEGSLNEIADCSGRLLDFSRLYGDRAHQTHRSGPTMESVPSLGELEELLLKSTKIREALNRIKEVVIAQNASFKDQRPLVASGHGHEPGTTPLDDGKQGGFAGSDPKKRRGRAAPPGRCHSCNRAETPEWRRGPDGARTLCNACGLHYAKLTRKMGGNKAALASSNLRPKIPGSPNSN